MHITKVQLSQLIANHLQRENGLNEVMEMTLNGMMKAERNAFLEESAPNKGNGYRPGKVYGYGKLLELRIPRDRNGEFHPQIWTLLRRQQDEVDQLVSALYGQGLTQSQVGEVFERLYGRHYSSSQIGRMIGGKCLPSCTSRSKVPRAGISCSSNCTSVDCSKWDW